MPTYEYECNKCKHAFERFQSITAEPVKRCPKCKGKVRRLLGTGAGIIFKGSGFYQTDYRSESYKRGKQAEKPATTTESTPKKKESVTPSATKKGAA